MQTLQTLPALLPAFCSLLPVLHAIAYGGGMLPVFL